MSIVSPPPPRQSSYTDSYVSGDFPQRAWGTVAHVQNMEHSYIQTKSINQWKDILRKILYVDLLYRLMCVITLIKQICYG